MADLIRMKRTNPPLIRKVDPRSVDSYLAKGWECLDDRPAQAAPVAPEPEVLQVDADADLIAMVDDRSLPALAGMGCRDLATLHAMSDKALLCIPWLTKKVLAKIRAGK